LKGIIMQTSDLKTWSLMASGTKANFYSLDFPDSLYICGDSGVILSTRTGAASTFSVIGCAFPPTIIGSSDTELALIHSTSHLPVTIIALSIDSSEFFLTDSSINQVPFTVPAN